MPVVIHIDFVCLCFLNFTVLRACGDFWHLLVWLLRCRNYLVDSQMDFYLVARIC